jgi:hypothetical protein
MGSCLVQQLLNRPAECAHPKDKLTIPAESVRRGKFWHPTLGEVKSTLYQDESLESVSIAIKHSVNMCFSANKMAACDFHKSPRRIATPTCSILCDAVRELVSCYRRIASTFASILLSTSSSSPARDQILAVTCG